MDISSHQAKFIEQGFMLGKMRARPSGFTDTRTNQTYCRSTRGRLLRHDGDLDQYNVLASDRQTFEYVPRLHHGERIDETRQLTRLELLPKKTVWEKTRDDFAPAVGKTALSIGLSAVYVAVGGTAWHLVQRPAAYLAQHMPFVHAASTSAAAHTVHTAHAAHTAGAAVAMHSVRGSVTRAAAGPMAAAVATYLAGHAGRASAGFTRDEWMDDGWLNNGGLSSADWTAQNEMHRYMNETRQEQAEKFGQWCDENPEACEALRHADFTAADYIAFGVGGLIAGATVLTLFNLYKSPTRSVPPAPRVRRSDVTGDEA